jgi:hypothetical protein
VNVGGDFCRVIERTARTNSTAAVADSERRLRRIIGRIDTWAPDGVPDAEPAPELVLPAAPTHIDLRTERIESVVWATGYWRLYLLMLDQAGEILHCRGVTRVPGLLRSGCASSPGASRISSAALAKTRRTSPSC